MIDDVKDAILLYYKKIKEDQYHRYRSWEHCYTFFQKCDLSSGHDFSEIATLHLAFYLASWGMYRASSKLLQKDYRVHSKIVAEIFDKKYKALWDIDFDTMNGSGLYADTIDPFVNTIKVYYEGFQISPTDTLVSKVMLGTFGCIPAYDNLYKNGVGYWNNIVRAKHQIKLTKKLGETSFCGLIRFYHEHNEEILEAKSDIDIDSEERGVTYPIMKLIDMYFWSLGEQLAQRS